MIALLFRDGGRIFLTFQKLSFRKINSDFDLVSIRYSYSLQCQKFSGASAFNASYLVVSAFHNLLTHSCQLKRTPFIYNADITADLLFIILSVIILKVSPLRSVHALFLYSTYNFQPALAPSKNHSFIGLRY